VERKEERDFPQAIQEKLLLLFSLPLGGEICEQVEAISPTALREPHRGMLFLRMSPVYKILQACVKCCYATTGSLRESKQQVSCLVIILLSLFSGIFTQKVEA
jgi:hypothetical protein